MGCVSSKLFCKELEKEKKEKEALNNNNNGVGDIKKNDSNNKHLNHIVSLTSSTYGLLNLENQRKSVEKSSSHVVVRSDGDDDKKRQRPSPSPSPPRETKPEEINAWELMEGLEEVEVGEENEPNRIKKSPKTTRAILLKGFGDIDPRSPLKFLNQIGSPRKSKTLGGKENRPGRASPAPGSTYYTPRPVLKARKDGGGDRRKAVASLSFEKKKPASPSTPVFDPELIATYEKELAGREDAVVVYTTTLRGIRKTFEDCNRVRAVVSSHGVRVEERDVSMDSGFREELRRVTGTGEVRVPLVLVKGRVVGGAEEVVRLEEEGELGSLFEGVPRRAAGETCRGCGGVRFVMCGGCSGSCKVLDGKDRRKTVRCGLCNENGLVHCPLCRF